MTDRLSDGALLAAQRSGARSARVRLTETRSERIEMTGECAVRRQADRVREIGISVVVGRRSGYAYGPLWGAASVTDLAERACALARSGPLAMASAPVGTRTHRSASRIDPFTLAVAERAEPLRAAAARAGTVAGVRTAVGRAESYRRITQLATSDGGRLVSEVTQTGAWLEAIAEGVAGAGARSYPQRAGRHATAGWEHVLDLDLPGNAERTGQEAVLIGNARRCPDYTGPVLIDTAQMTMQVHESIGHPLELDRILGWELDYAGGSFVRLTDVGSLVYAAEPVSVTADPVSGPGVGTMPWDDDGIPVTPTPLIANGLLVGVLGGAGAHAMGVTAGASARAEGSAVPLVRMSNVNLEPGSGSTADLLSELDNGIYLCGNRSFSIDDNREQFGFGCELAWRVRRGVLVEPLRAAGYTGRTLDFWRSCHRVAGPGEWLMNSVTFCAKGIPVQTMRVGHGVAPALFGRVQVEATA